MAEQNIPIDETFVEPYTPDALKHLKAPPKFTLKAVTRREREAMEYEMMAEGLRYHSEESLREVSIDELCRLWACDPGSEDVVRLRAYWEAVDDYRDDERNRRQEAKAAADAGEDPPPPLPPFEHEDQAAAEELIEKLGRSSPLIRRMGADNARYLNDQPRFAIAHAMDSWAGLKVSPRYEAGVVTFDSVIDLQQELAKEFEIVGRTAFAELGIAAISRIYLTEETEKNS